MKDGDYMPRNKKILKYIISSLCILICVFMILSNISFAINTDNYSGIYTDNGKQSSLFKVGSYALGVVQMIGMAVAIIMLIVLGIKYIISSPEDKATIKDKAVIYVTGAIIIFAASGLVGLVGNWAQNTVK